MRRLLLTAGLILGGAWLPGRGAWAQAAPGLAREEVRFAPWFDSDPHELRPLGRLLVAAQQRTHPRFQVVMLPGPATEAYRRVQGWCGSHAAEAPDVTVLRDEWIPEFARFLQPLNSLLSAPDLAGFPEPVRRRLQYADNLYGVPWSLEAWGLFYRADLLAAAGLLAPRSWEELLMAARKIHKPPEVYAFGLPGIKDGGAAELLLQMLWAQGGDLPPLGEPQRLDRARLQEALSLYADLHTVSEPEVLSWDVDALAAFFASGSVGMIIGPRSWEKVIKAAAPELRFAVAPLPRGRVEVGRIGLEVLCVMKGTPHLQASVELVRACTTAEACEILMRLGSLPFRSDVAEKHRADQYAPYVAGLAHARGLPREDWTQPSQALSEGLLYLLTGRRSVKQSADLIAERLGGGEKLDAGQ